MTPILKRIGLGIGLATLLVVIVGFMLPASYTVQRTVTVNADPARIHALVGDLQRWPEWSPWAKADPSVSSTYGEATTGVGAHQSWTSDNGGGELTFTACDPRTGISYDMILDRGKYTVTATMAYQPGPDGTTVVWSMTGHNGNNPFSRYFGLMMDPMVGPMFEDGLNRLKLAAGTQDNAE